MESWTSSFLFFSPKFKLLLINTNLHFCSASKRSTWAYNPAFIHSHHKRFQKSACAPKSFSNTTVFICFEINDEDLVLRMRASEAHHDWFNLGIASLVFKSNCLHPCTPKWQGCRFEGVHFSCKWSDGHVSRLKWLTGNRTLKTHWHLKFNASQWS